MSMRYRINGTALPPAAIMQTSIGQQNFRKGQIVFNGRGDDIIEPGEYLDPNMWSHAVGVAWTDCRLVGMD